MEIWTALVAVAVFFLVVFGLLPRDLIDVDLHFPERGRDVGAYLIILLVYVLAIAIILFVVVALSFGILHTIWISAGAYFLNRSVKRTWIRIRKDNIFNDDSPSWYLKRYDPPTFEALFPRDQYGEGGSGGNESPEAQHAEHLDPELNPLDHDNGDIRLLQLIDPETQGLLKFRMIQQSATDSLGRYVALSYWNGYEAPRDIIYIDDKRVKIRPNLHRALMAIDALCIKQSGERQNGVSELEMELGRMRRIFTQAKLVIAWLDIPLRPNPPSTTNGHGYQTFESSNRGLEHQNLQDPEMEIAKSVLVNPYWHRVWIVQEFAVNRKILLRTKDRNIEADELQRFVDIASSAPQPIESVYIEQVRNVLSVRQTLQDGKAPHLLDLLMLTKASFCLRDHDRVFGIHTTAVDRGKFPAEARYRPPTRNITLAMIRFHLDDNPEGQLDIILLGPHFAATGDLPTWCPDFFKFDQLSPDLRIPEYVRDTFTRAASKPADRKGRLLFSATESSECTSEISADNRILRTQSCKIGKIESLGWAASEGNVHNLSASPGAFPSFEVWEEDVAKAFGTLLDTLEKRDSLDNRLEAATAEDKLSDDYRRSRHAYTYFMLLVFGGEPDEENPPHGWYGRWIQENQQFKFGGRSLRDHAEGMTSVIRRKRLWRWTRKLKDGARANAGHGELRKWERINAPLRKIAKQHMRLMSVSLDGRGILGLAHRGSREGDEIFLLPSCSVPVILRQESDTQRYRLIGDAILPGAMFGEIWGTSLMNKARSIEIA